MSDQNTTEIETLTETSTAVETTEAVTKKERVSKPARPSVKLAVIQALATEMGLSPTLGKDGLEPKSFVHYGHKGGVEVHVARNEDVTRVYVKRSPYITDDTCSVPGIVSIKSLGGTGNVDGEVDFTLGAESALAAIKVALQYAKDAPAPVKVEVKPKAEKAPKAPKTETVAVSTATEASA